MPKNISEYIEEIKKFSEIIPGEKMAVLFGKTESGKYIPIKVKEDGSLDIAGAGYSPTITVAAVDSVNRDDADFKCDGVNDAQIIQQAIDSIPFGRIVFLEGNYYINSQIEVNKDNIELLGVGYSTRFNWNLNQNNVNIFNVTSSNVIIRNMSFNMNWTTLPNYYSYPINLNGSSNVLIENNYFINNCQYAVHVYNSSSTTIRNNIVDGGYGGFWIDGTSKNTLIDGNIIINVYQDGILPESGPQNTTIVNNIILNPGNNGIGTPGDYVVVSNNVVVGAGNWGIYASNVKYPVISNNSITGAKIGINAENLTGGSIFSNSIQASTGIRLTSIAEVVANFIFNGETGIVVTGHGNTIMNNHLENLSTNGIVIDRGTYNLVKGNHIHNVGGYGIYVYGDSRNPAEFNSIIGNYIYYPPGGVYQYSYAYYSGDYSYYNYVLNNKYKSGSVGGLYYTLDMVDDNFEVF